MGMPDSFNIFNLAVFIWMSLGGWIIWKTKAILPLPGGGILAKVFGLFYWFFAGSIWPIILVNWWFNFRGKSEPK